MFVRKKLNKSGVASVPVIEKRSGKSCLIKTIGSSGEAKQVEALVEDGRRYINKIKGQPGFNFDINNEEQLVGLFYNGIRELSLAGPDCCWANYLMTLALMLLKMACFAIWS